jgi:hypothetical protein
MKYFSRQAGQGRRESPAAVRQAVIHFLSAPNPAAARPMLRDHPELLGDLADSLLEHLIASAEADGRRDLMPRLQQTRALLRRCREIGVDSAFAEAEIALPTDAQDSATSPLSPVLTALIEEAVWAYEQYERRRDDETAAIAESCFMRLLSHPGFRHAPVDAQLGVRNGFADFLTQRHEDEEDLAMLDRAIALRREVVALTPGDWPDRPQYLRLLGRTLLLRWNRTHVGEDKKEALRFLRAGGAAGF